MAEQSEFMLQAIELATENVRSGRGGPFGAVVVRNGVAIATGVNLVTATCDPTAHAEVVAIRTACSELGTFDLRECDVYASCEPCAMCLAAIYWARCRAVYYGNTAECAARAGFDDVLIYREMKKEPGERMVPMVQMMEPEALESFALWNTSGAKVMY